MDVVDSLLASVEPNQGNPTLIVVGRVPSQHRSTPAGFFQKFAVHRFLWALSRLDPSSGELPPSLGVTDQQETTSFTKGQQGITLLDGPCQHKPRQSESPMPVRARSKRSEAHGSPLASARRARKKASACSPWFSRDSILTKCGSRESTASS